METAHESLGGVYEATRVVFYEREREECSVVAAGYGGMVFDRVGEEDGWVKWRLEIEV